VRRERESRVRPLVGPGLGLVLGLSLWTGGACDVCRDRKDTRLDVGPDSVLLDWETLAEQGGKTTALLVASVWKEVPDADTEIVITECPLSFESSAPDWLLLIPEEIILAYVDWDSENWTDAAETVYQDWKAGRLEMDPGYLETVSDERGLVPVLAYVRCPPVDCESGLQDACTAAAAGLDTPCTVADGSVMVTFGKQTVVVGFSP